ncbi:MAG: thioredoxin family protein [Phycisphaeraceae bacterium]|nr:thioredoxin family protein [Phycisphaeraceae bacterium]
MSKSTNVLSLLVAAGALAFAATVTPGTAAFAQGQPAKSPQQATEKAPKHAEGAHKHAAAKVGETAPEFSLTGVDGKTYALSDFKGKIVVLEWFNPECPVIVMHHKKHKTFADLQTAYQGKDVVFLAINSSAAGKEGAGKDLNAKYAKEWNLGYPVLLDESGDVGHQYGAQRTPHVFIVDATGTLAYAGAIDNGNPSEPGTTNYAKQAIDEMLAGKKVSTPETKAYGCSVKYSK